MFLVKSLGTMCSILYNMNIGEKLKELRNEKELTVSQAATQLSITRRAYSYYEKNQRQPDYDMLVKIAQFYGVSTDYLFGLEN